MKVLKIMFAFYMLILLVSALNGASLKLVRTIGNDYDEKYIFMRVVGGVLSRNKDIYVLDIKGHFIARYDWNGKFINKIGKRGKGPGCFDGPNFLDLIAGKLVFLDIMNSRTVEVDLNLKNIEYHKLPSIDIYFNNFFFIGKERFVGTCIPIEENEEYNYIKITDLEHLSEKTFFKNTAFTYKKKHKSHRFFIFSMPRIGIDRTKKEMVITFKYPNTSIRFFVYSFDGECLDSFSYTLDKYYRLPDFIKKAERPPNDFTAIMVHAIFVHKNHYIVHVGKTRIKNRWPVENEMEKYFLIFSAKTRELKHKLSVPGKLEAFFLSQDGYLVGTDAYEDIPKVYIYRLEF